MNGYLVVGVFIVVLALTLYWLQGRQAKKEAPTKNIEVVKVRDWPVHYEAPKTEPEKAPIKEPAPVIEGSTPEPEVIDIIQLSGVGPKYLSLLREAGITSINQVAVSNPDELLKLLHETNERVGITKRPPSMYNVEAWIEAAKA